MRTGEGFLLVYSITSRQSFDEIQVFQQQILRVKDKDYFPIIIVGNKCDLDAEREVSRQGMDKYKQSKRSNAPVFKAEADLKYTIEGENMARSFGCKFIETSAKSRINVDNSFYDIVREIRRYNKDLSSYSSGNAMGSNGPQNKMEMSESDKGRGCCGGKCTVM